MTSENSESSENWLPIDQIKGEKLRQSERESFFEKHGMEKQLDLFKKFNLKESIKISTGFPRLDNIFNGGFEKNPEMVVLGGISGLGKTSFAIQLGLNLVKNGATVIFCSLEMMKQRISKRVVIHNSFKDFCNQDTSVEEILKDTKKMEKVFSFTQKTHSKFLIWDESSYIEDIEDLVNDYSKIRQNEDVFVIIDYLQFCNFKKMNIENRRSRTNDILQRFKMMSKKNETHVVLLSSIGRDSYNKPMALESFKESGDIEYTAEKILAIEYRKIGSKDFNYREEGSKEERDVQITVLKNRDGESNKSVSLSFVPKFFTFKEASHEEEAIQHPTQRKNKNINKFDSKKYSLLMEKLAKSINDRAKAELKLRETEDEIEKTNINLKILGFSSKIQDSETQLETIETKHPEAVIYFLKKLKESEKDNPEISKIIEEKIQKIISYDSINNDPMSSKI